MTLIQHKYWYHLMCNSLQNQLRSSSISPCVVVCDFMISFYLDHLGHGMILILFLVQQCLGPKSLMRRHRKEWKEPLISRWSKKGRSFFVFVSLLLFFELVSFCSRYKHSRETFWLACFRSYASHWLSYLNYMKEGRVISQEIFRELYPRNVSGDRISSELALFHIHFMSFPRSSNSSTSH